MKNNLKKQYELRFSEIQEYRNKVWRTLNKMFFQQYIPENSDILDVGSGWGEFINNIEGKRKIAMDYNEGAKQYLDQSIEFINQDCSSEWPLAADSLDVVFTSNFLEHLPSKEHIEKTFSQASRCLKPGGRLICLGPNVKYLPGIYWDFWDHNIPITEMSLVELLKLNDFLPEKCLDKFIPYRMSNRQPPLIFLKIYLALPIAWKFFGQQFLIVAKNIK